MAANSPVAPLIPQTIPSTVKVPDDPSQVANMVKNVQRRLNGINARLANRTLDDAQRAALSQEQVRLTQRISDLQNKSIEQLQASQTTDLATLNASSNRLNAVAPANTGGTAGTTAPPAAQPADTVPVRSAVTTPSLAIAEIGFNASNGALDNHARFVRDVASQTSENLTTNQNIFLFEFNGSNIIQPSQVNSINTLNQLVDEQGANALNGATRVINDVLANGDPSIRTLNFSSGWSAHRIHESVNGILLNNLNLARQVVDPALPLTQQSIRQTAVDFVNNRLNTSPNFQQALRTYQSATERATNEGVFVVTAAFNDQRSVDGFDAGDQIQREEGSGINVLSFSPHVITVGAVNNNGTPNNFQDDRIADFSSQGNGIFNPTIVAHGDNVQVGNQQVSGTSFAAPQVSALIIDMLNENPNLRFDEVVNILKSTAVDTAQSVQVEGAGIVNPLAALQATQATVAAPPAVAPAPVPPQQTQQPILSSLARRLSEPPLMAPVQPNPVQTPVPQPAPVIQQPTQPRSNFSVFNNTNFNNTFIFFLSALTQFLQNFGGRRPNPFLGRL